MATASETSDIFAWARPKKKYIYNFHEGSLNEKNILGHKGANLCEMVRLGIPVPTGFVISTEACLEFLKLEHDEQHQHKLCEHLMADCKKNIADIEQGTNRKFGGEFPVPKVPTTPLLLSVRAGAPVGMGGVMGTILDVGINDQIIETMVQTSQNPRWAYDCYRRFLQMFGNIVLNLDEKPFEDILETARSRRGVKHDCDLNEEELKEVVKQFRLMAAVPDDPWQQLEMAIHAVFRSWNSPRAIKYRDVHGISSEYGTAVIVQSMVFGNLNAQSGSGMAFTRNPTTGIKEFCGQFLFNAAGEDISCGVRTPLKLEDLQRDLPNVHQQLVDFLRGLENHYRDVQTIEFTVQERELFILQTRTAKRTARAGVAMAVGMVKERMINEREALLRIEASTMDCFLHSMLDSEFADPDDPKVQERILGKGEGGCGGVVVGRVVFTEEDALGYDCMDNPCILVHSELAQGHKAALHVAQGLVTSGGNVGSYACTMMRTMGKTAVVGAKDICINMQEQTLTSARLPDVVIRNGDFITIDGSTGQVYLGQMPTVAVGQDSNFATVMQWADKYKRMSVLASAGTLGEVQLAKRLGAEGIGSFCTKEMFSSTECLPLFRQVIFAENAFERSSFLLKMLPFQQAAFLDMFRTINNDAVTICLLNHPLQDFLPFPKSERFEHELREIASTLELPYEVCLRRVMELQQSNPMLGFRGCRLSILYPEITEMQTRAIVGAAIQAHNEELQVKPQIVIPQVFTDHEVDIVIPLITSTIAAVCSQLDGRRFSMESLGISIGAMVETPRACIRADRIAAAQHVDFVSIGTNELTQLVFGMSVEDTMHFMPTYLQRGLIAQNPFECLDEGGVGSMAGMAVRRCRRGNEKIKVGICGSHAGDGDSVSYFETIGLDYLCCPAFRVPSCKIAAAQATIENKAMGGQGGGNRGDLLTRIIKGKVTV